VFLTQHDDDARERETTTRVGDDNEVLLSTFVIDLFCRRLISWLLPEKFLFR